MTDECNKCIYRQEMINASNEKVKYVCGNKDRLDAIIYASVYPDQPCNWFHDEDDVIEVDLDE